MAYGYSERDNKALARKLLRIGKERDPVALVDLLDVLKEIEQEEAVTVIGKKGQAETVIPNRENFLFAHDTAAELKRAVIATLRQGGGSRAEELYKNTLRFQAPYYFDDFCLFIEFEREKEKQFYRPRRKQLLPLTRSLQKLSDGELEVLGISLPPGVGKTTLAIFYLSFEGGRNPDLQILGMSHNTDFLKGVYGECLRILAPGGEYLWSEVFPGVKVAGTNAKDLRIDLGERKRFETLEFSSIGSGNAGKVRATNLLYCDDLVEGIEQAMSKDRMDKLWQTYSTDARQRKQGNRVKELHIATRWSLYDVLGRLEDLYAGSEKAEFIRVAALNEKDESNFDYPYGVGFTTAFYHEQRNVMDDASWRALYMSEPIEREGQLYAPGELRRFFELPEREPDAILAVADTKNKGDDYGVLPVAYVYGGDYYIADFVCDNGKPETVDAKMADCLMRHNVQQARFESNNAGGRIADGVQKAIKERGGRTKITTKWSEANKETRIVVASPWVKEHCLFLDESLFGANKDYRRAMQMLCSWTMAGGKRANKHDDVPDAMASFYDFVTSSFAGRVTAARRPW